MNIIKVTAKYDSRIVYINMDNVQMFCVGRDKHSEDTAIFFEQDEFPLYVKETPEQILELANGTEAP